MTLTLIACALIALDAALTIYGIAKRGDAESNSALAGLIVNVGLKDAVLGAHVVAVAVLLLLPNVPQVVVLGIAAAFGGAAIANIRTIWGKK